MAEILQKGGNTVGKGESICYLQFIIFPHCFQKTYAADT